MSEKSILVVEDDVDIRDALSGLLMERGYAVSSCGNGQEALTYLRSAPKTDVILLDLMMPVMDGWQFRVLQKRDPQLASIPVLAVSANGTSKAAAIDADVYLQKPIDVEVLLSAIERTILRTERRDLQAALAESERLAALGTLAAGVAHEINNPLAYVTSNVAYAARVLAKDTASPREKTEARAALAEAEDGCTRIRAIVRDLQLIARSPNEEIHPVDVRRVLDSAVTVAMHELRMRARIVKDYGEVPAVVASEGRLGQVFVNLLVNAAQAIPEGNVEKNEIRLTTRVHDSWVLTEVHDTGEGIPEEIRARIFEPFFTTKPVGVGTGLGLSIVRKLVEAAGGHISVESERGKGATFRVRLPASEKPASLRSPPPLAPTIRDDRRPSAARRARILVVDDEQRIGTMLVRALGDVFEVEATSEPARVIERVQQGERFDLVLCDLMMPGKSGMDVYAAVALAAPEQAARMLFMTGNAIGERSREFLASQPHPVVEKPFVVSQLIARLEAMLAATGARETAPE